MTKDKARALVEAVVKMREIATDTQAVEIKAIYPAWKTDVQYVIGDRVLYEDILYKVVTAHTSQGDWLPATAPSLFTKVLTSDDGTALAWVQPDSTNPYMTGDKVIHNEKTWISTVDNNVWEPGIYGWEEA